LVAESSLFVILRFLLATCPALGKVILFDLDRQRSEQTAARCTNLFPSIAIEIANDAREVIKKCRLISFATVAARPHVQTDPGFLPGTTVLQVSLRDLSEEIILGAHNIVDDVQHVCRAQTSVHLTEQLTGKSRLHSRHISRCHI
jgi:ornithine cyclodeaminase/alanine dehydrogenase-like protein (mu-crystallin family)